MEIFVEKIFQQHFFASPPLPPPRICENLQQVFFFQPFGLIPLKLNKFLKAENIYNIF